MFQESQNRFSSKIDRLKDRSMMLRQARDFFIQRGVLEVDCPLLTQGASIDAHIDLIPALYHGTETRYLHSSPEYGMKRLLVEGMGDIFQLAHVFRDGEWSHKHNPEFTMAEWYRLGFTFEEIIQETIDFISLFLGQLPTLTISYRDLFLKFTDIDYVTATTKELFTYIQEKNIPFYPSLLEEGKDACLNLILGSEIEPQLGEENLTILTYYPATQAALAQKRWNGTEEVAERFEIYYRGIELCNGYHELANPIEQRIRFEESNTERSKLGKTSLPTDELFLKALEKGLPECSGVAVGFDRLMMLRQNTKDISQVIAWGWEEA